MGSARTRSLTVFLMAALVLAAVQSLPASAQSGYKLRAQDTLAVTVAGQPDFSSKKYVIDQAGEVVLPLVGAVPAVGLTVEELAKDLRRRLADGFLVDPQVKIDVERPRRVFVFGGAATQGMFPLSENMTLIELLAKTGYGSASEALVIRPRASRDPALPADEADSEVIRVNLRELEKDLESGNLTRNLLLQEGDMIYIPRFDPNQVFVSGAVRNPGAYSVPKGTTVLQALTLAGGPTPQASLGRTKILRLVGGKQESIDARLDDVVKPGDTILVRERIW
jgi:protein involved in polysaccharide export with SLBB domain